MAPVSMTLGSNPFQGHDIIQRQKNSKMVQDKSYIYNEWEIESRIWSIKRRHICGPDLPLVLKLHRIWSVDSQENH